MNPAPKPPSDAARAECDALFANAAKRPVKSLAGIDVDLIARMVEVEGDLVVTGDLPDEALLVVKGGAVWVEGFVAGHIVADNGVAVQGNASGGHLIARQGDIHVSGGLLANVCAVALGGAIAAGRAEGPRCVFGWNGVRIAGDLRGGRVLGASVEIGGEAASAQIHAIGPIRAGAITSGGRGGSVVCLRQSLSCEDYGRPQSEEERRLTRAIGKHAYQLALMARLLRYANRDIQDSQRTVLYILLGGQLNAQRVRQLRGLQCQNNFLAEILAYADRVAELLQQLARNPAQGLLDEAASLAEEATVAAKTLEDDTRAAATIFSLDHRGNIVSACGDLQQWAASMKKDNHPATDWRPLLNTVGERRAKWRVLEGVLNAAVAKQVAEFGLKAEVVAAAETQPEKVESMLQQVVAKLSEDPKNERFLRLKSPVVRLINTQVERNRKNMAAWRKTHDEAQAEIAAFHKTLGLTAATRFADPGRDMVRVQAARFDAETVIAANPAPNADPLNTAVSSVVLSAPIATPTVFVMNHGVIQRQSAAGAQNEEPAAPEGAAGE